VWRISEPFLEQAQDDATLLAIRDMERAGIHIVTDGEIRRESYSNRFATALDGIDLDNPGQRAGRSGRMDMVPRVVGTIRRRGRSRSAMSRFCAPIPIERSRSRCRVRSP
jgi:5-methyltetrahydropteroyltriglutamate--homocysteine methyltransferase